MTFGDETREESLAAVGAGWRPIVARALNALPLGTHVVQTKEKFGGLRLYTDNDGDLIVREIIRTAEVACAATCEFCGQPGTLVGVAWLKTACEDCRVIREITGSYPKNA